MIKIDKSNKSRLDMLNNFFKNAVIDEVKLKQSSLKIKKILQELKIYSGKKEFINYFREKNQDDLVFCVCLDAKNKTIIIEKKSKKISQKLHNQSLYLINQFCFIIRDIQFYENDIDWTNWLLSLINKNITNAELEEELSNFISQSIHKVINNLKLSLLKQGGEINFVSIANNHFLMCFLDDTDLIHIVNNKNTIINKLHPDDVSQNLLLQTFDSILRKIKYKMIFINYGFVSYFDITENLYNKKTKKLNVKEFF